MVCANNTLAAFSESLGSDIIGSHCRKQGQDLREQDGSGSGESRIHALGERQSCSGKALVMVVVGGVWVAATGGATVARNKMCTFKWL